MKPGLAYIVLFAVTLTGAVAVIGGLYVLKPDILPGLPAAAADTTAAADTGGVASADTSAASRTAAARVPHPANPSAGTAGPGDSSAVPARAAAREESTVDRAQAFSSVRPEGLRNDTRAAASVRGTAETPPPPVAAPQEPPVQDSTATAERKAMARLFDGMKPDEAARIMKDLGDEQVKQILLSVKKRQAARILAALDPDRAARILR